MLRLLQALRTRFRVSLYTSHSLSRRAEESNKSPCKKKEREKKRDETQEDQVQGKEKKNIQAHEDLECRVRETPLL